MGATAITSTYSDFNESAAKKIEGTML